MPMLIDADPMQCPVCHIIRADSELKPGYLLPNRVTAFLQERQPRWQVDQLVCETCTNEAKAGYLQNIVSAQKGKLTAVEMAVIESIRGGALLTDNTDLAFERMLTPIDRLADGIARVVGHWRFSMIILIGLVIWITVNILFQPFEPYPMIIIAAIGATLASISALQGPMILSSQRHQRQRDRLQAEHEYQVNLKAELEIRYLHEKMDHMLERSIRDS